VKEGVSSGEERRGGKEERKRENAHQSSAAGTGPLNLSVALRELFPPSSWLHIEGSRRFEDEATGENSSPSLPRVRFAGDDDPPLETLLFVLPY
jgi:hypothetical protein